MARILVVDDESSIRISLRELLRGADYEADVAGDADEALAMLASENFDVVITDVIPPRITGVSLLRAIKEASPRVQVILMTGEPTIETASEAVRGGASDYLVKPIGEEQLLKTVANAARIKSLDDERRRLEEENRRHREELENLVEERTAALRKSEEQYHQAQKVESIGRLAGGVSHDLKNLLAPILLYSEMLLDDLDPEDERRKPTLEIRRAAFRAIALVHQLLAFSRKQALEYKPVNLNKAIQDFRELLRRTIREDIEIEVIPSPDIQTVMADIGQIEQVIMNLAVNAQDAMADGGRLTIETASVDLDEDYGGQHQGVEPGKYVMLAVSDTGCGMDEEVRRHVFEPFFSTKGEQGTGLGLATVYGIVKQHGGNIEVFSKLEEGTTFKVYWPVSIREQSEVKTIRETSAGLKGSETILVVEDNQHLRRPIRVFLERLGYAVLVAGSGKEALAVLGRHDGPLHLLFTDVVMPGINGRDLFTKVAESHPGLKVLYMSGYPADVIADRGVLAEGVQFLQKPFPVRGLAAKIREVLDGK